MLSDSSEQELSSSFGLVMSCFLIPQKIPASLFFDEMPVLIYYTLNNIEKVFMAAWRFKLNRVGPDVGSCCRIPLPDAQWISFEIVSLDILTLFDGHPTS